MSSQSPTGPEPVVTMKRWHFAPLPGDLFECFIQHVEYTPVDGGIHEHVWAERLCGTVDAATKRKVEKTKP